jgi:hypothetical protein
MTQDEARPLILDAFRAWIKDQDFKEARGHDALIFFGYLQTAMPHLLSFKYSGDKWQIVKSWLMNAGLVSH